MTEGPRGVRIVSTLLLLTALGTVAYWGTFFAGGDVLHASQTDVYRGYEHAFPVADAWMAACALAAAVGLVRRRSWAVQAGIAAGSALVFVGLLDVSFNVEQGLYAPLLAQGFRALFQHGLPADLSSAMRAELGINTFCLLAGPLFLWYFWR